MKIVKVVTDSEGKRQIVLPERETVEAQEPPPVAPHESPYDTVKSAAWHAGGMLPG